MSVETRSTVKEMEVFTSCALASKIPFTLQVRLKGPMPWDAQVRVMKEPSTTGSGDSGVMNGNGKAGGRGKNQLRTCYISQFCLVGIVMATQLTCFH